ncbi:MAG: GIY-YIG nuclease family protein [Mesorhizobium sp.]|nr:MAG: GIY-YIG nuclease family protein [Mesorhizobium sp.]
MAACNMRPPWGLPQTPIMCFPMTDTQPLAKVSERWGFGMAPPKPATQHERAQACASFLDTIASLDLLPSNDGILDAASVVKGLFNQVVREDQWDWFTVARQLGYPSRRISEVIVREITSLRTAIKAEDKDGFLRARSQLHRLPLRRCLSVFLGRSKAVDEPAAGWIYILSNREFPDLLKIGMTTRTVEQRAHEINGAAGVAIPFGVRRCWRVTDPQKAEKLVADFLFNTGTLRESAPSGSCPIPRLPATERDWRGSPTAGWQGRTRPSPLRQ